MGGSVRDFPKWRSFTDSKTELCDLGLRNFPISHQITSSLARVTKGGGAMLSDLIQVVCSLAGLFIDVLNYFESKK